MSPEKEKKIREAFPSLFRDVNRSVRESCMAFGCEHADGWFDLLWETCEKLQAAADKLEADLYLTQVKEKYGQLTIYLSSYEDEFEEIISDAEDRSASICEECGDTETAKLNTKGWITCLCDKCRGD